MSNGNKMLFFSGHAFQASGLLFLFVIIIHLNPDAGNYAGPGSLIGASEKICIYH